MENILCIDVEDWYHPEYVRSEVKVKTDRICHSFKVTLDLIKEFSVDATFFMVGEIAEKYPEILERINENHYEIAFHGYYHEPLWILDADKLRDEIRRFDSLVHSRTKGRSLGFRAPSYSLDNRTLWALDVLEDEGYLYDASLFPIKTPLYGVSGVPITPYHPSSRNLMEQDEQRTLIEFPALVYPMLGLMIPAAGVFYLRLLPVQIIEKAIQKMNKRGYPAILAIHTWELDVDIPKLKLGLVKSFVTYYNLSSTKKKLKRILSRFEFTSFMNVVENMISNKTEKICLGDT